MRFRGALGGAGGPVGVALTAAGRLASVPLSERTWKRWLNPGVTFPTTWEVVAAPLPAMVVQPGLQVLPASSLTRNW